MRGSSFVIEVRSEEKGKVAVTDFSYTCFLITFFSYLSSGRMCTHRDAHRDTRARSLCTTCVYLCVCVSIICISEFVRERDCALHGCLTKATNTKDKNRPMFLRPLDHFPAVVGSCMVSRRNPRLMLLSAGNVKKLEMI